MNKKLFSYLKISIISILLSIYFFQTYLTIKYSGTLGGISKKISSYKKATGLDYDTRTKYEIYNDLKNINEDVVVTLPPSFHLEYFGNQFFEDNLFPLSGISNKKTINCNENGYFSIYQSDRYGFNNPDNEWDSNETEYLLVGDSFTHGNCVNRPYDIGSKLRILSNKNVLNLGYAANGPLFQYATLREYLNQNIKNIIWIYSENDVYNLNRDLKSKILVKYLNDENFSQNLKFKQIKIDRILNSFLLKVEQHEAKKLLNDKKEKNSLSYKIEKFLTLKNIRDLFLEKHLSTHQIQSEIRPEFAEILKKSKMLSDKNGSKFYFVFLPSFERYGGNYDKKEIMYNKIKNIVKNLNIKFIDIHYELFSNQPNKLKFFPFQTSGHYNAEGYSKVSEIIIDYTSKN